MTQQPRMTLSTVVLDAPDARELADFYRRLLGWEIKVDEGDWVLLSGPTTGRACRSRPRSSTCGRSGPAPRASS